MSQEIIKVLDNLAQKFGIAIDWTNQNILPYLQDLMSRYISFKNAQAIIWIIISIIIIGLGIFIIVRTIKWRESDEYDDNTFSVDGVYFTYLLVGSIMLILTFFIVLFCIIGGLFQNIFMPEITILEYLKTINLGG